jgi:hypothetical protein
MPIVPDSKECDDACTCQVFRQLTKAWKILTLFGVDPCRLAGISLQRIGLQCIIVYLYARERTVQIWNISIKWQP